VQAPSASCQLGDLPRTLTRTRSGTLPACEAPVVQLSLIDMPLAASSSYEVPLLVFGALLVGGALLSGIAHRSFLSLTALFVLAGFILGEGGLEVLDFDPGSGFVAELATVALIVILFRDGLEVEAEMLQKAWHLPLRKLVLAMPITAAVVALATKALTDLTWTESFLLGALLSPTDPVLSSSVVTNPRVPRLIRHSPLAVHVRAFRLTPIEADGLTRPDLLFAYRLC